MLRTGYQKVADTVRRPPELDVREASDRRLPVWSRPRPLMVPWHRAPSCDVAAIYPCQVEAGLGGRGAELGVNHLAGKRAFCFDPFIAYQDGLVTSPNMVVAGQVGKGKSSAVKSALLRWVGVFRNRAALIYDPKGEYGPLAEALGLDAIRLAPGGSTRINPLDPGPAGGADKEALDAFRAQVIVSMQASVLRRHLTQFEESAVAWSIAAMSEGQPTLNDLAHLWGSPTDRVLAAARLDADKFVDAMTDMRLVLERLIGGPLRGMFEGRSTIRPNWTGRGLVIDLSAVNLDPTALPLVMLNATAWVRQLFGDHTRHTRFLQVFDEAWSLLHDEHTARVLQADFKLARAHGVANIAVVHRIRDMAAQADDGTATAKIADGLLSDSETRVMFAQPDAEVAYTAAKLGLRVGEAALLPKLVKGRALWKIRGRSAVVEHRLRPFELALTDTDARLTI